MQQKNRLWQTRISYIIYRSWKSEQCCSLSIYSKNIEYAKSQWNQTIYILYRESRGGKQETDSFKGSSGQGKVITAQQSKERVSTGRPQGW